MPAQVYQLLPHLDLDQLDALRASIETNGILQPIEVDEDGRILDGHHRAQLAAELGIACPTRTITGLDDNGKRRYALTVNLMRRQLDRTTRGALVAQLRTEGMSIRAIAQETGIPKSEVGRTISQLSQLGQLDQPERVQSIDGRERPSVRPSTVTPAAARPIAAEPDDVPAPRPAEVLDGPALPWPVIADTRPPTQVEDRAHAARVSDDIRRLITLAQTFGSAELRARAVALYSDDLGHAPMPPSGAVRCQELRHAADAILALSRDWKKK